MEILSSPNRKAATSTPELLEQGHAICSKELYTILQTDTSMLVGPPRDEASNSGISSDRAARISHHELGYVRLPRHKIG